MTLSAFNARIERVISGEPILQQERKEGATSYFVNMYPACA